MASSGSDRRALVFAVASLVVAGLVVAVTILVLTRSGSDAIDEDEPFPIGEADALESDLEEGGPLYFADPFGGDGFWAAIENDEVVALVIDAPGRDDCVVRWVGRRDTFEDCDDEPIETTELERYRVIAPEPGDDEREILVDLQTVLPPPATTR